MKPQVRRVQWENRSIYPGGCGKLNYEMDVGWKAD